MLVYGNRAGVTHSAACHLRSKLISRMDLLLEALFVFLGYQFMGLVGVDCTMGFVGC